VKSAFKQSYGNIQNDYLKRQNSLKQSAYEQISDAYSNYLQQQIALKNKTGVAQGTLNRASQTLSNSLGNQAYENRRAYLENKESLTESEQAELTELTAKKDDALLGLANNLYKDKLTVDKEIDAAKAQTEKELKERAANAAK
jgi:hypothetical protein